jgi:hypothetical protein
VSHSPPLLFPVHVVDDGAKLSVGHVGDEPVQYSATSHTPALGLHIVVARAYPSVHTPAWQVSSASHPPLSVAHIMPSFLFPIIPLGTHCVEVTVGVQLPAEQE